MTAKFCLATALLCLTLMPQEVSAQRFYASGANGRAGGFARKFQNGGGAAGFAGRGRYGSAVGGAVATPYGGGAFHNAQLTGPEGGTLNTRGAGAYKPGVGAFRQGQFSGTTANGGSGSGTSGFKYNAQTGQGTQATSAQFTSASGQNYGGSETTSWTKGQGGTTDIQTDNHGSYDVDWAKGQKPVVTPVPATTPVQ
ncbi:MAG: hypothetical protein JSS83_01790 [Cyanobacteria bacterium SZAS LIN-3]|nr:hypothetical protein [Cyanobacteria bacterium SZAS LIN-3]